MRKMLIDDIYLGIRISEYYNEDFDDSELYSRFVLLNKENRYFAVNDNKVLELYSDINTEENLYLTLDGEVFNNTFYTYDFVERIESIKDFFSEIYNMKIDNDFKLYISMECKRLLNKISDKEKISAELLIVLTEEIARLYVAYLSIADGKVEIEDEDNDKSKKNIGRVLDFNSYKTKLKNT